MSLSIFIAKPALCFGSSEFGYFFPSFQEQNRDVVNQRLPALNLQFLQLSFLVFFFGSEYGDNLNLLEGMSNAYRCR